MTPFIRLTIHRASPLIRSLHRSLPLSSNESLSDFELQYHTPRYLDTPPIPVALYGGRHTVAMVPGGGLGPEHCCYVRRILARMGAPVDFEVLELNPDADDNVDLDEAITAIRRNGIAIKGIIERRSKNVNVKLGNIAMRNELDLYVYVLWCKAYPGVRAKHQDIDLVVVRQNTEGEYSMLEHAINKGTVVESLKIMTEKNSKRVAKFAFEFARRHGRRKVTAVHKANIMKVSDGLFLEACRRVADEYPEIAYDDVIVDACTMLLVKSPSRFDVLLTPNLYGTVVANAVCGLAGGPGLFSGRNYGHTCAVFEPGTRNRGSSVAGKNVANPVTMLKAAADMLRHLGHGSYAERLEKAIYKTLVEDKVHTIDLGGKASSKEMICSIIGNL